MGDGSCEDVDVEFTAICSEVTLQSNSKGFFKQFADYVTDLALADDWLTNTFGRMRSDAEKINAVLEHSEIKEAIQETLSHVQPMFRGKSAAISQEKRLEAAAAMQTGEHEKALALCSQAVLKAPVTGADEHIDGGFSLAMALWARSECLMKLDLFECALEDLKMSLKERLPVKHRSDYYWRLGNCYRGLGAVPQANVSYELALRLMGKDQSRKEDLENDIKLLKTTEARDYNANGKEEKEDAPLAVSPNAAYPSLSSLVKIDESPEKGRYAVASTSIKTGATLAVDSPYAACLLPEFAGTHCAECFKRLRAPVWCPTCAAVAFCSAKCKERALSSYHKYECQFFDLFIGSGMSILSHIALRMLTQTGLQASLSIHAKYLSGHNNGMDNNDIHKNTFDKLDNVDKMPKVKSRKAKLGKGKKGNKLEGSTKPEKKRLQDEKGDEKGVSNGVSGSLDSVTQQIYSLCTHSDRRNYKDYLHRVLMALFLTKCLNAANFFEEKKDNDTLSPDEIAVTELVLRNLQLLQFNAHELYETLRSASHKFSGAKAHYIAVAIYPTGALFNHECYPAVGRYFLGKKIILKSLRPIKPNETIAENYGPQFLIKPKAERQRSLASRYWFKCECGACLENWPQLKEMTSGEIPNIKCPNEQCQKPLKCTVKNNMKTWSEQCRYCAYPISQREMHEKCKILTSQCIAEYERAAALMEAEKSQDATGVLCEAIDIFHEISSPPHKETHIAQEALRSCFADFGNIHVVT